MKKICTTCRAEFSTNDHNPLCYICRCPDPNTTGTKHDQGKPPLSLIPRAGLEHEARAFGFGAKKYGKNNYKGGMEWSRLVDAAMRHIVAFKEGEDLDAESGNHHLGHARACLGMLLDYVDNKRGKDDR